MSVSVLISKHVSRAVILFPSSQCSSPTALAGMEGNL